MYDYSDYYDYYDYSSAPAFNPLPTIISLVLCVFVLVCMWIIFRKAGKPGWAAIVPFYNLYVLFDITWGSGMRFLLMLIPLYNIILGYPDTDSAGQGIRQGRWLCGGTDFPALCFHAPAGFRQRNVSGRSYQGSPLSEQSLPEQPLSE